MRHSQKPTTVKCAPRPSLIFSAHHCGLLAGSCNLLRLYRKVEMKLWKKFTTDKAIAEINNIILLYVQPGNTTAQQDEDDSVSKSCTVGDVYGEGTLRDVFNQGGDPLECNSLRQHWPQNPQENISNAAIQEPLLSSIQEDATITSTTTVQTFNKGKHYSGET